MRRLVVLAFALLLLTPSMTFAHNKPTPMPEPTPKPAPATLASGKSAITIWHVVGLFGAFYYLCSLHQDAVEAEKAAKARKP